MTQTITNHLGEHIAYDRYTASTHDAPSILCCGGYDSSMQTAKTQMVKELCKEKGMDFLAFDYSGHGETKSDFVSFDDLTLQDWNKDACLIMDCIASSDKKHILVGSSMGAYIALNIARLYPDRVAGVIGIATAGDMATHPLGKLPEHLQADYDLLGKNAESITVPVILLHGSADDVVKLEDTEKLFAHLSSTHKELRIINGVSHRFNSDEGMSAIRDAVKDMVALTHLKDRSATHMADTSTASHEGLAAAQPTAAVPTPSL